MNSTIDDILQHPKASRPTQAGTAASSPVRSVARHMVNVGYTVSSPLRGGVDLQPGISHGFEWTTVNGRSNTSFALSSFQNGYLAIGAKHSPNLFCLR